jgi:hypothetical protein
MDCPVILLRRTDNDDMSVCGHTLISSSELDYTLPQDIVEVDDPEGSCVCAGNYEGCD